MKFLSFLGSRWFLTLLGTAALATLVWFLGPLIAVAGREPLASEIVRWIVIAVLLLVWLAVQIGSWLVARSRNRKLMEQLAASPEAEDHAGVASAEEAETLRRRFDEALAVLRESEGRKKLGGQWVYQLPWYLIIGPPGSGKTTALVSSGLRFPLAERFGQDPIHGIGGTRNCDWWFTDEAVLLDTAGRYSTQDSYAQVDSAAWGSLLGLLKKHRPRRPVNGVIVAMSLSDLLQQTDAERTAHSRAIRQRLMEIYKILGVRCPIYVMFTKVDLVAGFNEFFADLGQESRGQVWGMTFPLDDGKGGAPVLDGFAAEHRGVVERVGERLLDRMQQERDPAKRGLVFSFPRQLAALGEPVARFLNDTFAPTRFEERPLVRGVYFTSGTQTGTPIDRVLAAISANFGTGRVGALPFRGTPKSFFVTRLLKDVIFPEAVLAGLDPKLERRRLWLRRGAYATAVALTLVVGLAWTASYLRNRAYVGEVAAQTAAAEKLIAAIPPSELDPLALLPMLDTLRAIPGGYADREAGAPWLMGLGLYQGDKLGSQAQRTYARLLQKALLPRIMLRLEEQIRASGADPEFLFEVLRIYLMLGDPAHYDPKAVTAWVANDWERSLPHETPTEQQHALRAHLATLLAEAPPQPLPIPQDGDLVADARAILNETSLSDRLYGRLKHEGLGEGFSDFRIETAAGDLAASVLVRPSGKPLTEGVSALYTFEGYKRGFDTARAKLLVAASQDAWVLGSKEESLKPGTAESRRVVREMRDRYFRDYIAEWDALLEDIRLVPARDLSQAIEIARIVSDSKDSPLRRLLAAAADQTDLDRPDPGLSALAGDVAKLTGGKSAQIAGVAATAADRTDMLTAEPGARQGPPPEAVVSRHFAWLKDLMVARPDRPAPFDKTQQGVAQMVPHLKAVAAAIASGRPIVASGEANEMGNAKESVAQLPPAVAAALTPLVQDSSNLVAGGTRARLNNLWTSKVLPFCQEAIHDRYPFARGSKRDTTLSDFARVFGPDGLLDKFFAENLQPLVDSSRATWSWVGGGIGIPDSVLSQFQRAARIREAFFPDGGKAPGASFELTPMKMDARATQFALDIGGQVLDYRQGPLKSQAFKWPSPEGIARARFEFVGLESSPPAVTESGAWAWFRLLDRSKVQPTSQDELFRVAFASGGFSIDLELRASSVRNPFALQDLRGFQCPERL